MVEDMDIVTIKGGYEVGYIVSYGDVADGLE